MNRLGALSSSSSGVGPTSSLSSSGRGPNEIEARILSGQCFWPITRDTVGLKHPIRNATMVLCVPLWTSKNLQVGFNTRVFDQCKWGDVESVAMFVVMQVIGEILYRFLDNLRAADTESPFEQPIRVFLEAVQTDDSPLVGDSELFADSNRQRIMFHRLWIFKFTPTDEVGSDEKPLEFGAILAQMMQHACATRTASYADGAARNRNGRNANRQQQQQQQTPMASSSMMNGDISMFDETEQWRNCSDLERWATYVDTTLGYMTALKPENRLAWHTRGPNALKSVDFLLHPKNVFSPLAVFYRSYHDASCAANATQLDIQQYKTAAGWTFPLQKNVFELPYAKLSPMHLTQSFLPAVQIATSEVMTILCETSSQLGGYSAHLDKQAATRRWALRQNNDAAMRARRLRDSQSSSDDDEAGGESMHVDVINGMSSDLQAFLRLDSVVADLDVPAAAADAPAAAPPCNDDDSDAFFKQLAEEMGVSSNFLDSRRPSSSAEDTTTNVNRSQIACVLRLNRVDILLQHQRLVAILRNPVEYLKFLYDKRMREINRLPNDETRLEAYDKLRAMLLAQYKRECFDPKANIGKFNSAVLAWIHETRTNLFDFHTVRKPTRIYDSNMSTFGNWIGHLMELQEQVFLTATQHSNAMVLIFGSFTAYIGDPSMMRYHTMSLGEPNSSKSFLLEMQQKLFIPGTVETVTRMTDKAMQTEDDHSGHITNIHEFSLESLVNTFNGTATEQASSLKDLLTRNTVSLKVYAQSADGVRRTVDIETKAGGCFNCASNDSAAKASSAALSRYDVRFVRGGGRVDRTIDLMKLAKYAFEAADQNAYNYAEHMFRRRQALHYLVETLIYVGALPQFTYSVTGHVYARLMSFLKKKHMPKPPVRTDERVSLLVRVFSIQRAILLLFDVPGSRFYNVPFDVEQLMYLDKLLHDSEEIVYFVLGLLNETFADPIQNVVRLLLLEHVLETNRAAPHEGYRNYEALGNAEASMVSGGANADAARHLRKKTNESAFIGDAASGHTVEFSMADNTSSSAINDEVMAACAAFESDSSDVVEMTVAAPAAAAVLPGSGPLSAHGVNNRITEFAALQMLPRSPVDYSTCVIKARRTIDDLCKWLLRVWPDHVIATPSMNYLQQMLRNLTNTTVRSHKYNAPPKPGEKPVRDDQSEQTERKVLDTVLTPIQGSVRSRGYIEIPFCYLEDVDTVRGLAWAQDYDPIKEFITRDMVFSKTRAQKVIYGKQYLNHPNLFETLDLQPVANKELLYPNVLAVNDVSRKMLYDDKDTDTSHRRELFSLLPESLDSYATRQHLKRCFEPYDDTAVEDADPVEFDRAMRQLWLNTMGSVVDVDTFDYPQQYARVAAENTRKINERVAALADQQPNLLESAPASGAIVPVVENESDERRKRKRSLYVATNRSLVN